MTRKDTTSYHISVTKLDHEIIHFDSILERIQQVMPEDLKIYDAIVSVRDYMFRLQQLAHGLEIIDFCGNSSSGGTR
jgi:hypothetical protein